MTDIAKGFSTIQQESVQFNQPVSEAAGSAMGSAINGLLSVVTPIGGIIMAALNETQFQAQLGNPSPPSFVLADGRSVVGSQYQILTGNTNIPDHRGTYPRGSDNGGSSAGARGLDPNGTQAPGAYVGDQFAAHSHTIQLTQRPANNGANPPALGTDTPGGTTNNETSSTVGGTETAPKTTYTNFFIRIN